MNFKSIDCYLPKSMRNEKGELMNKATEITGFLIVVGLVLMPVGYAAIAGLNKTTLGITSGSTQETVLNAVLTISLAAIILMVLKYAMKGTKGK